MIEGSDLRLGTPGLQGNGSQDVVSLVIGVRPTMFGNGLAFVVPARDGNIIINNC